MREIKFRVWHKNNKNMEYFTIKDRNYYAFKDDGTADEFYEAMQYTGLKDVDKEDIYEGDVLIYRNRNKTKRDKYVVNWLNCRNGFVPCRNLEDYHSSSPYSNEDELDWFPVKMMSGIAYWFKKIGNIYENPELIK